MERGGSSNKKNQAAPREIVRYSLDELRRLNNQGARRSVHFDNLPNCIKSRSEEPGPSHGVRLNTLYDKKGHSEQPGTVVNSKSLVYSKRDHSGVSVPGSSKQNLRRDDWERPTFWGKRNGPVNLKTVENLVNNPNLEDVMVNIVTQKHNFEEMLSNDITDNMIVLMTDLLSRICGSNFDTMKMSIIQMALSSHFTDHLTKFISGIAIKDSQEKVKNVHFWNNPDKFWDSLIIVIRNIHEIFPNSSCEVLFKVVKMMNICIPVIELNQKLSVPNEIQEKITTLCEDVQNTIDHIKREHVETTSTRDPDPVPNDFRKLPIYPNTNEVTEYLSPFLRPNIIEGPYQSVEHYLDVQFRLNREDFVEPLREGICKFIKNPKDKWDGIKVYREVKFLGEKILNGQICYHVKFNSNNNTDYSRMFMFGSLLCFTKDNFATIIFGKVVDSDQKYLSKGQIVVGFDPEIDLPESLREGEYLMIESTIYFEPYYHVLKRLQAIKPKDLPLQHYILQVETTTRPTGYLLNEYLEDIYYEIDDEELNPLEWGKKRLFDLNHAQQEAFNAALTEDLAVIQGPPGTGKTFLGLQIAKTLLHNSHAWYKNSPMLIVCYTNHALDQFLEGLLPMELIRVGGQSKNEHLDSYNLKNIPKNIRTNYFWHKLHDTREKIEEIKFKLQLIEDNQGVVDFKSFNLPSNSWFSYADKESIWRWLCFEDKNFYERTLENFGDTHINFVDTHINCNFIIELKTINNWIQQFKLELFEIANNGNLKPWERLLLQKDITYDIEKLEEERAYLKMRLKQAKSTDADNLPDFVDYINPYKMSLDSRWHLYFYWLKKYVATLKRWIGSLKMAYQEEYRIHEQLKTIANVQIMRNALVVGMTTTMAARLGTSLEALKSPIVIIEEAAEVLESHIICSLTSHCKHLILLGDHKQLRPATGSFKIETKYKLGISLFERMIINKVPYHTLNIQHRMRPEISSLISPTIYPDLTDHESVMQRSLIRGVLKPLYFIDHQEPETICNDTSKKNLHEAELLINLATYLLSNGYEPENITILAAYLGQMFEMQKIQAGSDSKRLKDVRIAVLDNYQGEECDIILLSLVRSNTEDRIGFLKNENRVCVALSRAKFGFYMVGNMTLLANNSKIWPKIKCTLENMNAIGPFLSLNCQVHSNNTTKIYKAADFNQCMEGGCNLKCDAPLPCGHHCGGLCHVNDRDHKLYRCRKMVQRQLSCQHYLEMECSEEPVQFKCEILLENVKLPCEHIANKLCYEKVEEVCCKQPCEFRVESCGHACVRKCHIFDDPDHLQYCCQKPCEKMLSNCSIPNGEVHKCDRPCSLECSVCHILVAKKRSCFHVLTVQCHLDVEMETCLEPCLKMLDCGHKCQKACNEPCGDCAIKVEKMIPECEHMVKIICSKEATRKWCYEKCTRLLSCGHPCTEKCFETCTKECSVIVDCEVEAACGHNIKNLPCFLRKNADSNIPVTYCDQKCDSILKCGHMCSGNCMDCFGGRFHRRCQEKCGTVLLCNHACPIPCNVECYPCFEKCQYRCPHSKCIRICGDPCSPCEEQCIRRCSHQKCSKRCSDLCDVPPCNVLCDKIKKCGHNCIGFCGEPCPSLCRECDKDLLTETFLGNEDKEDAIYVMLDECKHIFEAEDMIKWLEMDNNEIKAKVCPRCKTSIKTTLRYSDYIKRNMKDIMKVKSKCYGSVKENGKLRQELLSKIPRSFRIVHGPLRNKIFSSFRLLEERLQMSKKIGRTSKRQTISRTDLNSISSKIQILTMVNQGNDKIIRISDCSGEENLNFIINVLMREDGITEQEIQDLSLEMKRFSRLLQCEELIYKGRHHKHSDELNNNLVKVRNSLKTSKRYTGETDDAMRNRLDEISKVFNTTVTEMEITEIVSAMGMKPGHWFKCPNGHPYFIGDCGGAMQVSTCPACEAPIEGTNHILL